MKLRRLSLILLICGVMMIIAVGATVNPASAETSTSVPIVANQPWTDSGVSVEAGQVISISASGTIAFIRERAYPASPAGTASCLKGKPGPFEAPGLRCYSLIGKIGEGGTAFEVGASYGPTSVTTAGELYLGPNDNKYPDNKGDWVAVVTGGTSTVTTTTSPPTTTPPTTSPPTTSPPTTVVPTTTTPTTTSTTDVVAVTQSSGSPPDDAPSGVLAFTGLDPVQLAIGVAGLLFVFVGLFLYFLGAEIRRLAGWFLGS